MIDQRIKTYGPDNSPFGLSARGWLHFVWLYGCCSGNKARAFLDQEYRNGGDYVRQMAEYIPRLPDQLRQKIAEEIGQRLVSNNREFDPPGYRSFQPR